MRPEEQRDSHDAHVRKKWVAATKKKARDNNTGPTQVAPTRAPAVMLVEVAPVAEDDLSKAQVQALVSNNEKDHAAPAVSIESPTKTRVPHGRCAHGRG